MKILTKYPVYLNKKKIASDDFSNMSDTLPTDPFSYLDYSNNDGKAAAITAGIGAAAGIGTALLNKPKAPLTDIEMKCGKMPKVGRKRKQNWRDCAAKYQTPAGADVSRLAAPTFVPPVLPPTPPADDKKNRNIIIGVSIAAVVLVGGFLLYSKYGKTAKA
jgi:hypothetical protein